MSSSQESLSESESKMVVPLIHLVKKVGSQPSAQSSIGSRLCVQKIIDEADSLFPGQAQSVRRVLSFVANTLL